MLLPLDYRVLQAIAHYQVENGVPPTHREIAQELEIVHYSTISRSIKRLKRAGLIAGDKQRSRVNHIPEGHWTSFEDTPYYLVLKG